MKQAGYSAETGRFPLADGGDGFASVMQHYLHTQTINCPTVDPLHREMTGIYEWSEASKTAIIELAVASGIALLQPQELSPLKTSTYGTGLLIKDAIKKGAKKVILGIGGSATNDAGAGILSALGFKFQNNDNMPIRVPTGSDLVQIKSIQPPQNLEDVEWQVCCDVRNPFFGTNGAAYVYGPQKGASHDDVQYLDAGLQNVAKVMAETTGKDVACVAGAGAAGGVAGGLMALLNATLYSGIDLVLDASGLQQQLQDVGLLITGEGRLDEQSLQGKVVGTMAKIAAEHSIPCIAYCGRLDLAEEALKASGITAAYAIAPENASLEDSIKNAGIYLREKVKTTSF